MNIKALYFTFLLFSIVLGISIFVYSDRITQSIQSFAIKEAQKKFGDKSISPEREQEIRSIAQEMNIDKEFLIRKMNREALLKFGYCNAFVYFYTFLNCIPMCSTPFLFISESFFEDLSFEERRFLIGHELVHIEEEHTRYLQMATYLFMIVAGLFSYFLGKRWFKKLSLSQELNDRKIYRVLIFFIFWLNLVVIGLGNCAYKRYIERVADYRALTTLKAYDGAFKIFNRWHNDYKVALHNPYYGLLADHPSCDERRTYCQTLKNNERQL